VGRAEGIDLPEVVVVVAAGGSARWSWRPAPAGIGKCRRQRAAKLPRRRDPVRNAANQPALAKYRRIAAGDAAGRRGRRPVPRLAGAAEPAGVHATARSLPGGARRRQRDLSFVIAGGLAVGQRLWYHAERPDADDDDRATASPPPRWPQSPRSARQLHGREQRSPPAPNAGAPSAG
jgi:hypothetical protein